MRPLTRPSLADEAYASLLEAIVIGRLAPGERIRDQELAQQLAVSRTPIREALKRLEAEGLVEVVPNSATRVAPVHADRAAQAFPVVAALHALAARLGVPALDEADDRELERLDAERAEALQRQDVLAAIELDDRFHGVVLRASRNDELARTIARLMPQLRRLDVLHFGALAKAGVVGDHDELLAACRRRDGEAAAALVEESFLRLGRQVERILRAEAGEF